MARYVFTHRPGSELLRQSYGPRQISSPDSGRETVYCVVGNAYRVFLGIETDDREDWTEHFLPRNPHRVVDAGEDGRLDKNPVAGSRLPPKEALRPSPFAISM